MKKTHYKNIILKSKKNVKTLNKHITLLTLYINLVCNFIGAKCVFNFASVISAMLVPCHFFQVGITLAISCSSLQPSWVPEIIENGSLCIYDLEFF